MAHGQTAKSGEGGVERQGSNAQTQSAGEGPPVFMVSPNTDACGSLSRMGRPRASGS